jgi:Tol biopolymer transport system component
MSRCNLYLLFALLWASTATAQNHPELEWQVIESDHFRVMYHQGLEAAAERATQIAEEAYGPITQLYGYEPGEKVRIVLKDYDDYANGAAFFYHDTIEIWTTSLDHDYELRGTSDWLRNVITHEFTHIVSLSISRKGSQRVPALYLQYFGYQREKNRPDILVGYPDAIVSYPVMSTVIPMWFAEGAAQYMAAGAHHDRWDTHRDMILRTQVLAGEQLSFDEMGVFGKCGFGNEYVYDHGYGLTSYIAREYGDEKLAELYRAASRWQNLNVDAAFADLLGQSVDELYASWVADMRVGYEAQVQRLGTLREGEVVVDKGFSNMRPLLSPDGQRLAYLSTQKQHYGPHMLVIRDLQSGEDEVIAPAVAASAMSFAPDGDKMVFARIARADRYGSRQSDIYEYDFAKEERGWADAALWTLPVLVRGYGPSPAHEKRLSRSLRALYPTYSPDGEQIVFVRNAGTNNNLGLMRADGSQLRYLTDFNDGTQLYSPRFAPDGHAIALSIARGGQRDIVLLRVGDGDKGLAMAGADKGIDLGAEFEVLVATEGTDRDPAWSPDGQRLYFSSDASGIFNIYALELATGIIEQVTNVTGGAFNPTVAEDGQVYFSAYAVGGFEIRKIEGRGSIVQLDGKKIGGAVMPLAQATPSSVRQSEEYGTDFLKTSLLPRLSIDEGRFKPGVYASSSDVLFRQNVFAGVAWAPANGDRDVFAIYEYSGLRPTLFLEAFHQKRNSARGDSSEARDAIINAVNFSLNQVSIGARGRIGRFGELTASATYDRYDASVEWKAFVPRRDGGLGLDLEKQKPFGYTYLNGFGVGLTYRLNLLARRRDRDISPLGRQIYFRYDRMYNYFLDSFNEQASFIDEEFIKLFYNQFTLEWNEHLGLPWGSRLGLRFYGGWIASDEVDDKERINDFFDYHLGGLRFMKGYTFYSIEGRKAAMATATLRFPIVKQWGGRFLHLYLDKVYGAVYGDIGKAWDGAFDEPDSFYARTGPLRDVGGQLRFDLNSYYSLPTRVQMDLAYGIDEISERSPWKFYLTVLFGYL